MDHLTVCWSCLLHRFHLRRQHGAADAQLAGGSPFCLSGAHSKAAVASGQPLQQRSYTIRASRSLTASVAGEDRRSLCVRFYIVYGV